MKEWNRKEAGKEGKAGGGEDPPEPQCGNHQSNRTRDLADRRYRLFRDYLFPRCYR